MSKFFSLALVLLLVAGCIQAPNDMRHTGLLVEVRAMVVQGLDENGQRVQWHWIHDRISAIAPDGSPTTAYLARLQGSWGNRTYLIGADTHEPLGQMAGETLLYSSWMPDAKEHLFLLPWRLHGHHISTPMAVNFLGMVGEVWSSKPEQIRARFPETVQLNGESHSWARIYEWQLNLGVPMKIETWVERDNGSTPRHQVLWRHEETHQVGAKWDQPPVDLLQTFVQPPIFKKGPWKHAPPTEMPSALPFTLAQALEWAKSDSATIGQFFASHPNAFLRDAYLVPQWVDILGQPAILSYSWAQEWWADHDAIKFEVTWELPIGGFGTGVHLTRVEGRWDNGFLKTAEQTRSDMVSMDAAYRQCHGGENPVRFGYREHSEPSTVRTIIGGVTISAPLVLYSCNSSVEWAMDAYTGLFVSRGLAEGQETMQAWTQ